MLHHYLKRYCVQEKELNAFREFLAAIRVRPELLPEPVACLVGSNIPGSRRLIYGGVTKSSLREY